MHLRRVLTVSERVELKSSVSAARTCVTLARSDRDESRCGLPWSIRWRSYT